MRVIVSSCRHKSHNLEFVLDCFDYNCRFCLFGSAENEGMNHSDFFRS